MPTPRSRPRSLGAMVLAAIAGVGITVVSSSVFGRCGDDGTAARAAPAATPPGTGTR